MDYSEFVIRECPDTAIYIPNFISPEEENAIITQVSNAPKPKWTQLSHRRLINYGGVPHLNGMIAEEMPNWLQLYINKVNNLGIFDSKNANHVLVNEYLPGQGIMPHLDGPLFYPTISTISCGSHTVLEFYEPQKLLDNAEDSTDVKPSNLLLTKLLIEPRSLLILKEKMYHDYLHSISELENDLICDNICNLGNCGHNYKLGERVPRQTRLSLTIRHVPKTSRMKFKIGK